MLLLLLVLRVAVVVVFMQWCSADDAPEAYQQTSQAEIGPSGAGLLSDNHKVSEFASESHPLKISRKTRKERTSTLSSYTLKSGEGATR